MTRFGESFKKIDLAFDLAAQPAAPLKKRTPPKTNIDTKNHALEKVTQFEFCPFLVSKN